MELDNTNIVEISEERIKFGAEQLNGEPNSFLKVLQDGHELRKHGLEPMYFYQPNTRMLGVSSKENVYNQLN